MPRPVPVLSRLRICLLLLLLLLLAVTLVGYRLVWTSGCCLIGSVCGGRRTWSIWPGLGRRWLCRSRRSWSSALRLAGMR